MAMDWLSLKAFLLLKGLVKIHVLCIRTLEGGYSSKHTYPALVGAEVRGLQKSFPAHPEGWREEGGMWIVKRREI